MSDVQQLAPPRPPEGAPNVVLVLLDDVGFGAASQFGGLIETPAGAELARDGLHYNRFHTTAICSPTRASLLTGRDAYVSMPACTLRLRMTMPGC